MPISTNEIIKLICDVSEEEKIKIAVSESLKGGAIAGCATVIGGLIMGPVGLAAGGTLGGITSYFVCKKFQSVPSVISRMDPSKREMLIHRVNVLNGLEYTDYLQLTALVMAPEMKARFVGEVVNFLQSQMHMNVIC
ncbi:Protein C19orf12-like protein [Armadillidium nasatum]|uniref:Protein C19orf12-like protein n=1 Tax=Armadillidium nasatum TaxID=96803 RepID=A0A5N5TEL6_9CRUS|nr:Protein C19orf12-like protein [Armadillidium nasatum]